MIGLMALFVILQKCPLWVESSHSESRLLLHWAEAFINVLNTSGSIPAAVLYGCVMIKTPSKASATMLLYIEIKVQRRIVGGLMYSEINVV